MKFLYTLCFFILLNGSLQCKPKKRPESKKVEIGEMEIEIGEMEMEKKYRAKTDQNGRHHCPMDHVSFACREESGPRVYSK